MTRVSRGCDDDIDIRGEKIVGSAGDGVSTVGEAENIDCCGSLSPDISTSQCSTAPLGYLPPAMLSDVQPLLADTVLISDCTSANTVGHSARMSLLR